MAAEVNTISLTAGLDAAAEPVAVPRVLGPYEFVRQLRADEAVAGTRVIFFTAHYHEPEARRLATACGVTDVLTMRVGETARVMLPRPIVLMKCDQELLKLDATVDTLLLTAFKDGKTRCGFWYEKSAWPHRTMELEVKP